MASPADVWRRREDPLYDLVHLKESANTATSTQKTRGDQTRAAITKNQQLIISSSNVGNS